MSRPGFFLYGMNWAQNEKPPPWTYTRGDFSFEVIEGTPSLWIVARFPAGGEIAFRAAYCPDGKLEIDEIQQTANGIEAQIRPHLQVI